MSTVINWDNVEETSFEVLAEGEYILQVKEAKEKESKEKKTPMWEIVFDKGVFHHVVLNNNISLGIFKRALIDNGIKLPSTPEMLAGAYFKAKVVVETYNGTDRNKIKSFIRMTDPALLTANASLGNPNAMPMPTGAGDDEDIPF